MTKRTKKRGSLGRDYAPLYEPIMLTEAVRTLPLSAYKLWTVAVVLCKPWINGAVPLTRSVLARFGLNNCQTVSQGIKLLVERGLIVQTRKAVSRRCALFGVTHLPMNHEAMKKSGARETPGSRSTRKTTNAVCSPDHKQVPGQTTNSEKSGFAVCSADQNTPISTIFAVCSPDASKNLPSGISENAHLLWLLDRVRAHGGTVTAGTNLRVRWWRGDPPADLAGELKIHSRKLYQHLANRLSPDGSAAVLAPPSASHSELTRSRQGNSEGSPAASASESPRTHDGKRIASGTGAAS